MKSLKRIGQKKQKFDVKLTIIKIGAEVENDCIVKVVWKRGPQADNSDEYDLNQYEPDVEADYIFNRISTFYTKDSGKTYDKKNCDFQILLGKDTNSLQEIAKIENHNMAPFVNKTDTMEHIAFPKSKYTNTFIYVKWNITETEEEQMDLKLKQISLEQGRSFSVSGVRYSADQVQDFLDERDELQADKDNLDQNMSFILSAKLDLEVRYKDMKAGREKMEKEIAEIKPTLTSTDDKLDALIKQKNQQVIKTQLENEIFGSKKADMEKHIGDLNHKHNTKLQSLLELKTSLEIISEINQKKGGVNPDLMLKNEEIKQLRNQLHKIQHETVQSQEEVTQKQMSIRQMTTLRQQSTLRQSSLNGPASKQLSSIQRDPSAIQREPSILKKEKTLMKIPTLKPVEQIVWTKKVVEEEFDQFGF